MKVSVHVLGRPLLELRFDRAAGDAAVDAEPEQRIGFYGGAGLYAERGEPPHGVGDGNRTRPS